MTVAGASIPEAAEIAWLIPKDHVLVNPRAYTGTRELPKYTDVEGVLNALVTPFNFRIGELEKRCNGAFD
jgi:hypothetical protein